MTLLKLPSKPLRALASDIEAARVLGNDNPDISAIDYDSRRAKNGSLFVAIPGLKTNGREFVKDAIQRGAVAVAAEASLPDLKIPQIIVPNARKALAELSWSLFDHPERKLTMVAVTGTNGKTTVANCIAHILSFANHPSAVCGTLGTKFRDAETENPRTTPESSDLAAFLAGAYAQGATHCVMEATSIGIVLERVWKIPFRIAVFTNLSRDHLDFHGSWENYRDAKLRLFAELSSDSISIINADDPESKFFVESANGKRITYGIESTADYRAKDIRLSRQGASFTIQFPKGQVHIESPFLGQFNVYNILAAAACTAELDISLQTISETIRTLSPVRGRAEVVPSSAPFTVLVDYAHTPDALKKILMTLREIRERKIHVIIGAGGDRDKGKRPQMAKIAQNLSDFVYLTSDNPRSENPMDILNDMRGGLDSLNNVIIESDRKIAVHTALAKADAGDIVLIAGKGHETYQEISGVKYPFDDRAVALDWLSKSGFSV